MLTRAWEASLSAINSLRATKPPARAAKLQPPEATLQPERQPEDGLLDLAQRLEPDGGNPGKDDFERMVRSLVAVLAFLIEGHTNTTGAFRAHVQRLTNLLETAPFPSLSTQQRDARRAAPAWMKQAKKPTWRLSEVLTWDVDEAWNQMTRLIGSGSPGTLQF